MFCPLQSSEGTRVACAKDECALFHEGDCAIYVIAEALGSLAANTADVRNVITCGLGSISSALGGIDNTIGAK